MKALSGVDAAFLHLETAQTPMHIASLSLFEPPKGGGRVFHAAVRRELARRLPAVPVFRRKLAPMPLQFANPVWVDDDAVDLDHHVQYVTLPPPGTPAQFEDCAAKLHAQPLDRSRPLWRLHIIDGLHSGEVGYYIQVHHAVLDGQAGVLLAQTLFDLSPRPSRPRVAKAAAAPAEHPGVLELAAAALRHDAGQYVKLVRHIPEFVRTLGGLFGPSSGEGEGRLGQNFAFGPHTPLNVPITADRGFAGLSLPMATLRSLAEAHGVTLNDIVLALCSGALRRYLAHHGGIPEKPLTAAMPISLREAGDTEYTIRATMPLVNLQTHIADPLRRLRAIHEAAGAVKAMVKGARSVVPMDFPSIGVPWVLRGLAELYERSHITAVMPPLANVVISNVHGPQVPLYVAGTRMSSYWPMSIVDHGLGLNITVISYAGTMGFGFTTARVAVPEPHLLTQALLASCEELAAKKPRRTRPPAARRPRAAARPTTSTR